MSPSWSDFRHNAQSKTQKREGVAEGIGRCHRAHEIGWLEARLQDRNLNVLSKQELLARLKKGRKGVPTSASFKQQLRKQPEVLVGFIRKDLNQRLENVPERRDLEVWLAKERDGRSWAEIARCHFPKTAELSARKNPKGISAVRRAYRRVEDYLLRRVSPVIPQPRP